MPHNAQVLVFASQKGGSGKTTLSGHVAVAAELAGAGPVALVDTDPQGSLAKWWNSRASATPAFAQVSVPDLADDIDMLKQAGFRLIVVDTPPAVTSSIAEIVTYADLVVVPTRPSPHDLRAVGPTVDIIEHQRKPLVFVINGATARARITGEMAVALSQHGTVAPVTVHHRVDFAASMVDGRTVGEVNPASRSAREIASLWDYLNERLMRLEMPSEAALHLPRRTVEDDILSALERDAPVAPAVMPGPVDGAAAYPVHQPVRQPQAPGMAHTPAWTGEDRRAQTPVPRWTDGWDGVDRRGEGTGSHNALPDSARDPSQTGGWDGVDRRKADLGPPPGMPERRMSRPVFGRRGIE